MSDEPFQYVLCILEYDGLLPVVKRCYVTLMVVIIAWYKPQLVYLVEASTGNGMPFTIVAFEVEVFIDVVVSMELLDDGPIRLLLANGFGG